MRPPWGKLGALSHKINPLGGSNQKDHATETARNGNGAANGIGKGAHMSSPLHGETAPVRTQWGFRRCGQNGSRPMKRCASAGTVNGTGTIKNGDVRIDINLDESSDLLGEIVMSGNLTPPSKGLPSKLVPPVEVSAKLTTKAFMWGLRCLYLEDIVAPGLEPSGILFPRVFCRVCCVRDSFVLCPPTPGPPLFNYHEVGINAEYSFIKTERGHSGLGMGGQVSYYTGSNRFTIHSYALMHTRWVPCSFGKARRRRHDMQFIAPSEEEALRWANVFSDQDCYVNVRKAPPKKEQPRKGTPVKQKDVVDVQIKVKPGPLMLVVLNPRSGRGKARKVFRSKVQPILELAGFRLTVVETTRIRHAQDLASTIKLSECPDGIICVGGDGIVNEVLNGLLSRDDAEEARTIPLGIIPAGSDNSLVWTVLGIRDPTSAAVAIVKGGLVATDVIGVEWQKTGAVHMGLTVAYYGFMSDVLELSAKYQRRCGPLRYFVAGALRLLCLSHYKCEVHYLPASSKVDSSVTDHAEVDVDPLGQDASSLEASPGLIVSARSSADNLAGIIDANSEPSDYIRGLDGKAKRVPSARTLTSADSAVTVSTASPPPRARTRSKSKSRSFGLSVMAPEAGARPVTRRTSMEGSFDGEVDMGKPRGSAMEEERWESRSGPFLGVMMCNHQCKTVQCMESQALAPLAEHDDGSVHLLLVRDVGRLQLIRFFVLMQFGRHLSLPFVEHTKARAVWLKPSSAGHRGCGIDGELLMLDGPIMTRVQPYQCQLIGKRLRHS